MCSGACGSEWGRLLAREIVRLREEDSKRDFLLRHLSKPAGYAAVVATFRRCLVCYTELDAATAMRYTLHSLNFTTLCWAGQLSVDDEKKAAQGHHRARTVTKSVEKYRRDDVLPQLACQEIILKAIRKGWVPLVPAQRGVRRLELGPDHITRLLRHETMMPPLRMRVRPLAMSRRRQRWAKWMMQAPVLATMWPCRTAMMSPRSWRLLKSPGLSTLSQDGTTRLFVWIPMRRQTTACFGKASAGDASADLKLDASRETRWR